MTAERRAGGEIRVAGRTLLGVAMPYRVVSPQFRERFEPGAFGEVRAIDLNLQHDPGTVLARGVSLTDGPEALRVSATLPDLGEVAGTLALVRRGALRGFSVEFRATTERREGGVRVVERADLTGLALVDRPAYPGAGAEVRARSGRTMRARVPAHEPVECQCSGVACRWAELGDALAEAINEGIREGMEIVAARGSYAESLASTNRGTLRMRVLEGVDGEVEIDLPESEAGRVVLKDHEAAGVVVRPYLDAAASEGVEEEFRAAPAPGERLMRYRKLRIRGIIVAATDARAGWPEPEVIPTPGEYMPEGRAAPRRRRIWL